MAKCRTCGSSNPHLHPAVQHEGEVHICTDDFHLQETAQNKPEYIAAVHEAQKKEASRG